MLRTFAMGEANWQLRRWVRVRDQRGHVVHIQDQSRRPTLPPHQHRLCLSSSDQLERAHPTTWQGCYWWAAATLTWPALLEYYIGGWDLFCCHLKYKFQLPTCCLSCSVCHLYILQLPVRVFPPRREECVENVPSELGGGAEDLPSWRRLCGGFHGTEEGLWDLLLLHLLPLPRYENTPARFVWWL